jgi:hypothetical protein
MSSIATAENPRVVASFPGMPTMREPFGNCREISLSPSPRGTTPSRFRKAPDLAHEFAALAGGRAGDEDEGVGPAPGGVERFDGADRGLAPLPRAVEDRLLGLRTEDAGLRLVRFEAELRDGEVVRVQDVDGRRDVLRCGWWGAFDAADGHASLPDSTVSGDSEYRGAATGAAAGKPLRP